MREETAARGCLGVIVGIVVGSWTLFAGFGFLFWWGNRWSMWGESWWPEIIYFGGAVPMIIVSLAVGLCVGGLIAGENHE